jgi:geranylgeranyl diphosphate synthase, type II
MRKGNHMHSFGQLSELFNKAAVNELQKIGSTEPLNLYQPVVYTLEAGGKRLRPVLLMMGYELFADKIETTFPAAMAIEMFHNFTLLHDDMMDGAELRRNRETIHIKYSNNAAILSGDAMSILSYHYISLCETDNFRQIFNLFTHTALKICEGQQFDMDFETRNNVTVEEYLKMIGLKTAILLAASLKIGALLANASPQQADLLYRFGFNLGMAFQLQDDYLDTYGNTTTFGKNIGGDIVANKKTFLMLTAIENANGNQLAELQKLLINKTIKQEEKVARVIALYNETGVVEKAKTLMEQYYQQAIQMLKKVDVPGANKTELIAVAEKMMQRDN